MKIKAVIFDWAGTLVDYGSRAPVATLQNVFEAAGVPITREEARQSMGLAKKAHIAEILAIERVKSAWFKQNGRAPEQADLDLLYADFEVKQLQCLCEFSSVIPGVPESLERLRRAGVKAGSTTGYTRSMLDCLLSHAGKEGCAPDLALCPDDVSGGGRPFPYMCYRSAIDLQVFPLSQMVKIGDTPSDIAEGLNAGMWTIGITRTGNEVGLSEAEWSALSPSERNYALEAAGRRLRAAGAHYLSESVADCLPVLEQISARIAANERP